MSNVKRYAPVLDWNIVSGQKKFHASMIEVANAPRLYVLATDYEAKCADYERLRDALEKLYYAGKWSCDRAVDEAALWEAVRDAAGFEKGKAPKLIPPPAAGSLEDAPKAARKGKE